MSATVRGSRPILLWLLQALFMARVAGQALVGLYAPAWLPTWDEWQSGLLPYPLLLPAQLVLIVGMTIVSYDNTRGSGRFCVESQRVRSRLRLVAAVYAGAMLLRYGLTMAIEPDMRWLHGTVPIAFHLVLAAYLAVLALHARAGIPAAALTKTST